MFAWPGCCDDPQDEAHLQGCGDFLTSDRCHTSGLDHRAGRALRELPPELPAAGGDRLGKGQVVTETQANWALGGPAGRSRIQQPQEGPGWKVLDPGRTCSSSAGVRRPEEAVPAQPGGSRLLENPPGPWPGAQLRTNRMLGPGLQRGQWPGEERPQTLVWTGHPELSARLPGGATGPGMLACRGLHLQSLGRTRWQEHPPPSPSQREEGAGGRCSPAHGQPWCRPAQPEGRAQRGPGQEAGLRPVLLPSEPRGPARGSLSRPQPGPAGRIPAPSLSAAAARGS